MTQIYENIAFWICALTFSVTNSARVAMGNLVIASWAQANDLIKVNTTESRDIFSNTWNCWDVIIGGKKVQCVNTKTGYTEFNILTA